MQIFPLEELLHALEVPLISTRIPAGFPSPATDYIETRIDLNRELIKNPAFTFLAYNEGHSMEPEIPNRSLMLIDRKITPTEGCVVLASINREYCVRYFFKYKDGSIELRAENPNYKPIHLPDSFEGEFEIFGCVTYSVRKPKHASRRSN